MSDLHCRYNYETYNDCFQEGCMGLLAAIRNYNSEIGEFSTYAYIMIKCFILNYYSDSLPIKPTQKIRVMSHKFRINQNTLTSEELKKLLSCQEVDIEQLNICCNVQSLNQINNNEIFVPDLSADEEYKYIDTVISIMKTLNRIISEIPQTKHRTKKVNHKKLYKEYVYDCILNGEAKSISAYAKEYDVSKQRMQIIIRDFKEKFKEYFY